MADALDILTLAEAKVAVGLGNADSSQDEKLALYITAASGILDDYVGPVVQRAVTEELDGSTPRGGRTTEIVLCKRPVADIATVNEYVQGATTSTTLTADDNSAHPAEAYLAKLSTQQIGVDFIYSGTLLRRKSGIDAYWEPGRKNIVVVYTAGRFTNTASVTAKYKRGCGIILENLWRDQQVGLDTFDQYQVPKQSFPTFAMPRAVKDMFPGEYGQQEVGVFA